MARRLEWRCLTCGITAPPTGKDYILNLKHTPCKDRKIRLIDIDSGEELASNIPQAQRLGLIPKKPKKKKGKRDSTAEVLEKKPQIGTKGDEHIKQHYTGYSKDGESFLFVIHPDGGIRDLRLEYPLLYPIFELMQKERGYGGDFPQFMADAVETLFANAGYELALVPKTQGVIYQEVVRLLGEGKLELVTEENKLTLEVRNGDQAERAREQALLEAEQQAGGESTEQGEEESAKSQ